MLFLPAALTVVCTNVSRQLNVFEVGLVLERAISTSVETSTLRTGLVNYFCSSGYNVRSYQLSSKYLAAVAIACHDNKNFQL
jgi:hypothetical protein